VISLKTLNAHIKSNNFTNLYLLHGEEDYLKKFYENKFKEKILSESMEMMNFDFYEGKSANPEAINDALQTVPFMSEKRLAIVKNSGLFATGRKDDSEKMAKVTENIPDTSILMFIEDNVDKRNSLYKKLSKIGVAEELNTPSEAELTDWVIKLFKPSEIVVSRAAASLIVRTVTADMLSIEKEVKKLESFKKKGEVLMPEDIEIICTKSLETRVFDLVDAVASKNISSALMMYKNLITLKESPIMILGLIYRQLRLIYLCSELAKMVSPAEIATSLNIKSFVVSNCIRQSKNFSKKTLLKAIDNCLKTDFNIKSGKISDVVGVEVLLIGASSS